MGIGIEGMKMSVGCEELDVSRRLSAWAVIGRVRRTGIDTDADPSETEARNGVLS